MNIWEMSFTRYVFVITGMSYIVDSSGTSKVVKAQEEIFVRAGLGYVVIFPISRSGGEGVRWKVRTTGCYGFVVNGRFVGVMTSVEVLNTLVCLKERKKECIGILIHHVIRHDLEDLKRIVEKIRGVPVVFYLHDFYTCCVNPNMLKNDRQSCVGQKLSCADCVYAGKRERHLRRIRRFLAGVSERLTFVAPSVYMRDRWTRYYPEWAGRVVVLEHQRGVGRYPGNRERIPEEEPLRLAFTGAQKHIKGWDVFQRVVEAAGKAGCHYRFYYFGTGSEQPEGVISIPVEIAVQGKDAMIRALRENRIAAVFLVSQWGETYSYTMYESHAANSYIVTTRQSGNIACVVSREQWGKVYPDAEELLREICDEKEFRRRINAWRGHAAPGAMEYVDNDAVKSLFDGRKTAELSWQKQRLTLPQIVRSRVLNAVFTAARLRPH